MNPELTKKEKEAFQLIVDNPEHTYDQLALFMGITRNTFVIHVNNIYEKKYVRSRHHLVDVYYQELMKEKK